MKKIYILILAVFTSISLYSKPRTDFTSVMKKAELNPVFVQNAEILASLNILPVHIYLSGKALIDARDVEDGKIVYTVITDFVNPFRTGYTAFYEDIIKDFDLSKARICYADGRVVDNTGEVLTYGVRTSTKLLLVPDWTNDKVYAFDYNTGDLVDPDFIPTNAPNLQSPKHAIQKSATKILVSDQLSDVVHEYDSSGAWIRVFAPAGGVNNSILDNIRGIGYKPNGNLLVCNAGTAGNSQNTVQEFDTGGAFVSTFISVNLNSPFTVLYRASDILVTSSSGTLDITKHDFSGNYIGQFTTDVLNFPQQLISNPNGNIVVCEFSGTKSGLRIYDSNGNLLDTLKGVTGNRGVFRLPNGNYLTTTAGGVHEIDDTTGVLVRTIVTGSGFQYLDVFDPNFVTGTGSISPSAPQDFTLHNNYPNPFNPVTKISYDVPRTSYLTLKVYDNLGREVTTLFSGTRNAGTYTAEFDGTNLSSGIYNCILKAGNFITSVRMVLIK